MKHNYKNWSKSAIYCYKIKHNCSICEIKELFDSNCKMQDSIQILLDTLGEPPQEEEIIMYDEDLNLEYSEYLKSTVEAIKRGYETLKDIAANANITPHQASVYVDNLFNLLEKKCLLAPQPNKCKRETLSDFIQSRLLDKDYVISRDISADSGNKVVEKSAEEPVKVVRKNEKVLPKISLHKAKTTTTTNDLTETEKQVVAFLCQGLNYKQTADKMFISITTLKSHVNNIFTKKNYHSLQDLILGENKQNSTELKFDFYENKIQELLSENENLRNKISKLEKNTGMPDFSTIKEKLKAKIELLQSQLNHIEEAERILSEV